ncbi:MAG: hypothetical protein PHC88_15185 [Terrimicrobiaceae bacterium]|nr:hypothetical protein [Terrimicrobiaceae bacterium]
MKLFVRPDAGKIDTTSKDHLQYQATFNLDAGIVGSNPLPSTAWKMGKWLGVSGASTNFDYETMRLYNTDPGIFPGLDAPQIGSSR